MSDERQQPDPSGGVRASDAEPARRTPRGWLSRDDRDRRAIE